jgi:predicted acylesterase/phospholipase RssA
VRHLYFHLREYTLAFFPSIFYDGRTRAWGGTVDARREPLRVALTISGAIALGAYEGGVLAALLSAFAPLYVGDRPELRIDSIGGASAGSITGLLAARCLAEGLNAVEVMREAWVDDPDLSALRSPNADAPLSIDAPMKSARRLLSRPSNAGAAQSGKIRLSFALGALRPLDYEIDFKTGDPVHASTFLDWKDITVEPGQGLDEFLPRTDADPAVPRPPTFVEFALASGANPLGFAPVVLDRSGDAAEYDAKRITNFPATGAFWYTDGGTLDNEPLGRTLDLVDDPPGGDEKDRMLLLIHPHPGAVPHDTAWADPKRPPTWLETLLRAQRLQTTQSIYDDLRHAEKTNRHIDRMDKLSAVLVDALQHLEPEQAEELRSDLAAFLQELNSESTARRGRSAPESDESSTGNILRTALDAAAGLAGKRPVGIEVLSPLLLPEAKKLPVEQILAGEFLWHFGGFVDVKLRQHDFDLGYRTVTSWLEGSRPLRDHGLDHTADARALFAAKAAYKPSEPSATSDDASEAPSLGSTTLGSLELGQKLGLLSMAGHIARVIRHDVTHASHQGEPTTE